MTKKGWDDLVIGAIEKIATAPSKLKDSKESVGQAIEWVKSVRDDIQSKIAEELPSKLAQIDWNSVGEKVATHMAENFDVKVEMKLSFTPKKKNAKSAEQKPKDSKSDHDANQE